MKPGNAVAALILVEGGYLLQQRNDRPDIFFPGCWGCFGGAVEPGESKESALVRELQEEIGLTFAAADIRFFTQFDFDFSFAGRDIIWRTFYEIALSATRLSQSRLGEGAAMRVVSAQEIEGGEMKLTPYDSFALWLHINRARLRG